MARGPAIPVSRSDSVVGADRPFEEPSERRRSGRVLFVGGDRISVDPARARLGREGFHVDAAATSEAASAVLTSFGPDIVILDARVPDGPAIAAFGRLRAMTDAPTILTGLIGGDLDRVLALDAGLDDVLTAPASPAELAARIRAVLRRSSRPPPAPVDPEAPRVLQAGAVSLDDRAHTVSVAGRAAVLTALEYRLLTYLFDHVGEALSREQLLAEVWGYTVGDGSTVTVHVRRLREKIEPDPANPTLIHTVWGVGYRFEPP